VTDGRTPDGLPPGGLPPSGLTVVKLGGSHALSPLLRPWLDAIGRAAGDVVVVPGGGPFADTVRAAQPAMGFDDAAAHDMAMMAMAQYARALTSLADGFVYADTLAAVQDAVACRKIPVWSPWPGLRAHPDIPRSWDVTADSLAIWLASALSVRCDITAPGEAQPPDAVMAGAGPPSMPFPRSVLEGVDGGPPATMTGRGRRPVLADPIISRRVLNARRVVLIKHRAPAGDDLLDAAFPRFAERFRGEIIIVGPDDLASADALFGAHAAATA